MTPAVDLAIEVQDLRVHYGGREVLHGISFAVCPATRSSR
jgi:ABC-type histidine transport system ATPase subunit